MTPSVLAVCYNPSVRKQKDGNSPQSYAAVAEEGVMKYEKEAGRAFGPLISGTDK